jgi:hypothetical protein
MFVLSPLAQLDGEGSGTITLSCMKRMSEPDITSLTSTLPGQAFDIGFTNPAAPSTANQPSRQGGTQVLNRPDEDSKPLQDNGGDADRYAHYVSRRSMMEARKTGRPVVALCGKVWVPKHNPAGYPICPDCKRIYEQMMGGNNNHGSDGSDKK